MVCSQKHKVYSEIKRKIMANPHLLECVLAETKANHVLSSAFQVLRLHTLHGTRTPQKINAELIAFKLALL